MNENGEKEIIDSPEKNVADSVELTEQEKEFVRKSKEKPEGGVYDPVKKKWSGYHPIKGVTPNWSPFDPKWRKSAPNKLTIRERKFMAVLSTTGSMAQAFRAAYTIKEYGSKHLESIRVAALAHQVLKRVRKKDPKFVEMMTFEDITPDFVKKEMMKLYYNDDATIPERTRLLELMGKSQALFTDKHQVDSKIQEVVDSVYKESDKDFPENDQRIGRQDIEIGRA